MVDILPRLLKGQKPSWCPGFSRSVCPRATANARGLCRYQPKMPIIAVEMCRDFAFAWRRSWGLLAAREEKVGCLVRLPPEWNGGFKHDAHPVTCSAQRPRRLHLIVEHMQTFHAAL